MSRSYLDVFSNRSKTLNDGWSWIKEDVDLPTNGRVKHILQNPEGEAMAWVRSHPLHQLKMYHTASIVHVSPDGHRVVFKATGDVYTTPKSDTKWLEILCNTLEVAVGAR